MILLQHGFWDYRDFYKYSWVKSIKSFNRVGVAKTKKPLPMERLCIVCAFSFSFLLKQPFVCE